jgi:hypothetical protein
MSLESITQQIREEISKLTQALHLLEGGAKHTVGKNSSREEMSQKPWSCSS